MKTTIFVNDSMTPLVKDLDALNVRLTKPEVIMGRAIIQVSLVEGTMKIMLNQKPQMVQYDEHDRYISIGGPPIKDMKIIWPVGQRE